MKSHKHAKLIKAWADGQTIQYKNGHAWWDWAYPDWDSDDEYRIKPEPQPNIVKMMQANYQYAFEVDAYDANLKLIFDGETGILLSAEVVK